MVQNVYPPRPILKRLYDVSRGLEQPTNEDVANAMLCIFGMSHLIGESLNTIISILRKQQSMPADSDLNELFSKLERLAVTMHDLREHDA